MSCTRSLLHVTSPVVSEVVLPSERLVANVTRVRPLVRVGSLVDEEVVGLCEMPAAELANKFLFGLGREPAPRGLPIRGQLAQLRYGRQLGQVRGFRRILLRGGEGQVGKVEPRPVLAQRGHAAVREAAAGLLRVKELRRGREGQRREGNPGIHQALGGRHLRDGGPQALDVRVTQSPVVHVHGLHGTQAVQALQLVARERVDCLQEGVVGELERRVQWNRRVQGFASHLGSEVAMKVCSEGGTEERHSVSDQAQAHTRSAM